MKKKAAKKKTGTRKIVDERIVIATRLAELVEELGETYPQDYVVELIFFTLGSAIGRASQRVLQDQLDLIFENIKDADNV